MVVAGAAVVVGAMVVAGAAVVVVVSEELSSSLPQAATTRETAARIATEVKVSLDFIGAPSLRGSKSFWERKTMQLFYCVLSSILVLSSVLLCFHSTGQLKVSWPSDCI